jgi:hypothetical protein
VSDMTHCPDCGADTRRIRYPEPRCPFKRGPGYGPCGEPRALLSVEEAARRVSEIGFTSYNRDSIVIPLKAPNGSPYREWFDLKDAIDRAGPDQGAGT